MMDQFFGHNLNMKNVPLAQLLNCARSGPDHQCLHSQDAGVICYGMKCDVVSLMA